MLEVQDLTKSYGSNAVLRGVDLSVAAGQVHALLGPNGAGKSTLIECLAGTQLPDTGVIKLDGETLPPLTPTRAFESGFAVIHQHFSLVDNLSVTDNLFLGHELRLGPAIRTRLQARIAADLLEKFGLTISGRTRVGSLTVGAKQLLELAKAWHRADIKVLILDEPTAALSRGEDQRLFDEVARLKKTGARIIYTSHRLPEVFKVADYITVLRDGVVALSGPTHSLRPEAVVSAISGGPPQVASDGRASSSMSRPATAPSAGLKISELEGPTFGPTSLTVAPGEIVGLYGVLGSGRSSLLETVAGRFTAISGEILIDGRRVPRGKPAAAIAAGLALVPSDRQRQALWRDRPAAENLLMPSYQQTTRLRVRQVSRERQLFRRTATQLHVVPSDPRLPARSLSGGNQQKLVLGRWMARRDWLKVLLLDEPTQGVDIGARTQIYHACRALADNGVAILFASSEASEVETLADRALVMRQGTVVSEYFGGDLSEHRLMFDAHALPGSDAATQDRAGER
jgi:ribose transport system ATP-binding protein